MRNFKEYLWLILYWILYSGIIRTFVWDNLFLSLVPDVGIFLLWILSYKYKCKFNFGNYVGKYTLFFIYSFIFVGTLSAIINGMHFSSFLWNIRYYIRYPLIAILIWKFFDSDDIEKFKSIIYKAYPINFICALVEWRLWGGGDHIGGLFFGGNSIMVLYLLPTLILMIGDFFQNKIGRLKFYMSILVAMFLSFIGEIKLLYIVVPLFVYAGYVLLRKFTVMHIIVLLVSCISFVPIMQYMLSFFYDKEYVEEVFDTEQNINYTARSSFIVGNELAFNRSTSIENSNELFLKDQTRTLIGYGFGAASVSDIFYHPIGSNYKMTFFFLFSPSYLLIETGWIGFVLFILIYISLQYNFLKQYYYPTNIYSKNWGYAGFMICLFTYIMMWYNNSPLLSYSIVIFFLGVIILGVREGNNKIH